MYMSSRVIKHTNTMSSMRLPEDSSQAKVTNLDFPLIPIDKDVITLEISVDYRWVMAVQIQ